MNEDITQLVSNLSIVLRPRIITPHRRSNIFWRHAIIHMIRWLKHIVQLLGRRLMVAYRKRSSFSPKLASSGASALIQLRCQLQCQVDLPRDAE